MENKFQIGDGISVNKINLTVVQVPISNKSVAGMGTYYELYHKVTDRYFIVDKEIVDRCYKLVSRPGDKDMKTGAEREAAFRKDLQELLEKHNAELWGTSEVTMYPIYNENRELTAEYTAFDL